MEENDISLLDDYFNGLLPQTEQEAVRSRVATDPDFAREFELRQQMDDWPRREPGRKALAETLTVLNAEFFQASATAKEPVMRATVNWRRYLAAAASVAVLIAAVWYFAFPEPSLYSQYAQHPPLALVERGASETAASAAERTFNAGNYGAALAALDSLLQIQPENPVASLYQGICLLELKRFADARAALAGLATGQSALRADAIWYTALSYLPENNPAACRDNLTRLRPGDDHFDAAQTLMRKLK